MMRAFVVSVNGDRLCTAGIGDNGVLSSIVTWSGLEGSGGFHMSVGGLDTISNQHLNWPVREIGVGDEIVVRIIETKAVDDPLSSRTQEEIEAAHETSGVDQTGSSVIVAVLILF